MVRHVVAMVEEIPPGGRKRVEIGGRGIAVFNVEGTYFAIADRCPHEGASLCEGRVTALVEASEPGRYSLSRRGEMVRCPWHGWEFDIRTGRSRCDPKRLKVRSYETSVETGEGAELRAETFPVSVEARYIVVEA
jgi:3-phenylpropionate/trans-cinnamate dioxygenase ferredoxin subunit